MELEYFDLLDNEPIYIKDVGTLKPPTLRDIKKIYNLYETFIVLTTCNVKNYLQLVGLNDKYNEEEIETLDLYNLIVTNEKMRNLYLTMFSFFICENVTYDDNNKVFIVWKEIYDKYTEETKYIVVGLINKDNFNNVRSCIAQLNYLSTKNIQPPKYKNKRAEKIAAKIAKGQSEMSKKSNSDLKLDLPHMISKYCADNKNGINLLNVFDLTVYQFYDQFRQHNHIRQSNLQDAIYSHSVSYSDTKFYDPELWLK